MSPLFTLSEWIQSFFLLWTFLLCLIGIFTVIHAATQKQFRLAFLSLLPFGCSYFLWQMLFDLHLFGMTSHAAAITGKCGALPWGYSSLFLLFLTVFALLLLFLVIRRGKRSVTPNAVKRCLDQMPCGVCCWYEDGRVLFSNNCMNGLCIAITGSPLLNGNHFHDALSDEILTADGKRWRFTRRDLSLDGEHVYEMIASDVTAEYAKTQALERDKEDLSRVNRELREYTGNIDDTVRRQEILQAKVNIHDEMNRLMLSTMVAESDAATLDKIFSLWKQNALLLCMEASKTANTRSVGRLEKLAQTLKIRLIWENDRLALLSKNQRALFFSAAQEAIVNAAKHAGAKNLTISFEETGSSLSCTFANDGKIPAGEVNFSGGLYNLSLLAKKQGVPLRADTGETFRLTLDFRKNHPNGGCVDRVGNNK
ncbi:MAG: hypothetical protein IJT66_01680 [Clostridia bacterium]|nr:hypothetical protein [Clostridia bacterium]